MMVMSNSMCNSFSGIFYDNVSQELSYMVGGICRLFQFLHDFFCLDQFNAVGFFIKQLHDEKVIGFIRMVFYLMELLTVIFQSGRILLKVSSSSMALQMMEAPCCMRTASSFPLSEMACGL